ncbi:hypothetical protein BSKO_12439 [Bryopsis sp. KO-2023]|nr:hypothetical protein BSKO_12439 [Bryopsis sp. KO-2023]
MDTRTKYALCLLVVAGTCLISPAAAGKTILKSKLTPEQEVGGVSNDTPSGARASAFAILHFDKFKNAKLNFRITYAHFSGPLVNAHFHMGVKGVNGPVVQTICGAPAPSLLGECPSRFNSGVLTGVWTVPRDLLDDLLNKGVYINLHTALNMDGEVRGQLFKKY